MKAGLAYPDWPLCYGNVIPDFQHQIYFEFIHRVVAGLVGIATVVLQIMLMANGKVRSGLKALAALSLVLLGSQIVLGGLTVLWQLKANVVASHLGIGTAFFAVLLWISLELRKVSQPSKEQPD